MKILVVDDQKSIAEGIRAFLIQKGFSAFCVHSGSDALNFLEHEPCDLVISDFKMPDLNGLELLKILRSKKNNIDFVLISAFLKMEDLLEAIKLKITDVFSKPFKNRELLQCIEALKTQKMPVFQTPGKNNPFVTGWNHSITEDYDLYLFHGKSFQGYFSYFSGNKWRFLFYASEKYSVDYLEGCFSTLNILKKSFKDICHFFEQENVPVVFLETDFRKKVEFFNPCSNPVFYLKPEGELFFIKEKQGEFEFSEEGIFGISEGTGLSGDSEKILFPKGGSRLHPLFFDFLFSASSSFRPFLICSRRQKKYCLEFDFKKNGASLLQLRQWLDPIITSDLTPSCSFRVKSFFSDLDDLQDREKDSFFESVKLVMTSKEVFLELQCHTSLKEIKEIPSSEGDSIFLRQLLKQRHDSIMEYAGINGQTLSIRIPAQ